jgi:GxxExxY protein
MLVCEEISRDIIGAAMRVHRALGPGLLESAYETCLGLELRKRGLAVRQQVLLPIVYEDHRIDAGYRLDMLVQEQVVVELKSIRRIGRGDEAQLLTYLRLARKPVGLLINFNVLRLRDGILRRAWTPTE